MSFSQVLSGYFDAAIISTLLTKRESYHLRNLNLETLWRYVDLGYEVRQSRNQSDKDGTACMLSAVTYAVGRRYPVTLHVIKSRVSKVTAHCASAVATREIVIAEDSVDFYQNELHFSEIWSDDPASISLEQILRKPVVREVENQYGIVCGEALWELQTSEKQSEFRSLCDTDKLRNAEAEFALICRYLMIQSPGAQIFHKYSLLNERQRFHLDDRIESATTAIEHFDLTWNRPGWMKIPQ